MSHIGAKSRRRKEMQTSTHSDSDTNDSETVQAIKANVSEQESRISDVKAHLATLKKKVRRWNAE